MPVSRTSWIRAASRKVLPHFVSLASFKRPSTKREARELVVAALSGTLSATTLLQTVPSPPSSFPSPSSFIQSASIAASIPFASSASPI